MKKNKIIGMKICLLAANSSIHTVRWVNALSELGHTVSLISMQLPKKDKLNDNVKLYQLKIEGKLGYYFNFFELKKILNKLKPDILNVHYASGYGTLSRLVNFEPTLLSVLGSDVYLFPYVSKRNKITLKKNLKAAQYLASTSKAMAKQTNLFLDTKQEIEITPFGIDLNSFHPNKQKVKEEIIIGTVKSLKTVYGIDLLIKGTAKLIERLKKESKKSIIDLIKLRIVGEGLELDNLVKLTKSLDLVEIVEFAGSIPNDQVPKYLNEFDIFCAFSRSESFGVAVLEASACEVPVVVSNVGGLPEVVVHGETGYIIESENIDEIAERLYELVLDKKLRQTMGKNGREFVEENYDWEQNVLHMESIYKKIIQEYNNK